MTNEEKSQELRSILDEIVSKPKRTESKRPSCNVEYANVLINVEGDTGLLAELPQLLNRKQE